MNVYKYKIMKQICHIFTVETDQRLKLINEKIRIEVLIYSLSKLVDYLHP